MAEKVSKPVVSSKTRRCPQCQYKYLLSDILPCCGVCNHCGCKCVVCTMCRKLTPPRPSKYCARCMMCKHCDKCRHMPAFIHPMRLNTRVTKGWINPLPRILGVELEIGDWKQFRHYKFKQLRYSPAHDWSVKPSEEEMVITPLGGDQFFKGMIELAQALDMHKCIINETCALHVHVDGTDLSAFEVRRLLYIYANIEADVYKYLIAPWRSSNPEVIHYCQMLTKPHVYCERCERYDTQYPRSRATREVFTKTLVRLRAAKTTADIKAILVRTLYGLETPNLQYTQLMARKGGRYEWCRYVGLNLHAWQHRGTIEWRMKEGTENLMELTMWPLFCGWVTHAATRMNDVEAEGMTLAKLCTAYMPRYVGAWVREKMNAKSS